MPEIPRTSPLRQHARTIAWAIYRARFGIDDSMLVRAKAPGNLTAEQQVRDQYKPWSTPQLSRSVALELRDIEARTYLTIIDSLAAHRARTPAGAFNVYKFRRERPQLFQFSHASLIKALREDRRREQDERESHRQTTDTEEILDWVTDDTEPSFAAKTDPGKLTLYTAPASPLSVDREDRGRGDLRKQLARRYAVKAWADRHQIDEIFASLYALAPWMAEPIRWLWEHQLLNLDDPFKPVRFPPLLIVGPPGSGKTYLAQKLGELAGLTTARIDMSVRSAAFDIGGAEYTWRSASPGIPVRTLGNNTHANPLIILDEIDKAGTSSTGGDPVEALLPLLQPDMARSFSCPFLQGPVDLSWLSWFATANDMDRIPDPIRDRMKIFRVDAPRGDGLRAVVATALLPAGADPVALDEICRLIEAGKISLRSVGRLAAEFAAITRRPLHH